MVRECLRVVSVAHPLVPSCVDAGVEQGRCWKVVKDGRSMPAWVSMSSCRPFCPIVRRADVLCFMFRSKPRRNEWLVCAKQLIATMVARGLLEETVIPNEASLRVS